MWATAEPVVRDWIERNLGPAGRLEDAARGLAELGALRGRLPEIAGARGRSLMTSSSDASEGHALAPDTIGSARRRRQRAAGTRSRSG